ncbi:hypothetical protein ACQ4PT_064928 [Festuca glaucescens]
MGRVRTKTVKKTSRQVIEKYYSRMTLDFHTNKKVLEEVSILQSKRLRNKVAGFTTHLMRRIQRGPVRASPSSCRRRSASAAWTSSRRSPLWRSTRSASTRRRWRCSPSSAWASSPASTVLPRSPPLPPPSAAVQRTPRRQPRLGSSSHRRPLIATP